MSRSPWDKVEDRRRPLWRKSGGAAKTYTHGRLTIEGSLHEIDGLDPGDARWSILVGRFALPHGFAAAGEHRSGRADAAWLPARLTRRIPGATCRTQAVDLPVQCRPLDNRKSLDAGQYRLRREAMADRRSGALS